MSDIQQHQHQQQQSGASACPSAQQACSRRQSTSSVMSTSGAAAPFNDPPLLNPEEDEADRVWVERVIKTFQHYRVNAHARVNRTENYLNSLPSQDQQWLCQYRSHLSIIRDCIDKNQEVIKRMLREKIFNMEQSERSVTTQHDSDGHSLKIRHQDIELAQATLKLIARDWSAEGAEEREQAYKPIIDAIEEFYRPDAFDLNEVKILVPGAGLGRLAYELASRGYECEGNEFSYFFLIASNFVLNYCYEENQFLLYPWIHQYVNNLRKVDQVAAVRFPDVCPAKNPPKGNINVVAGDFLKVYKDENSFDCVATCFFIDCANNIIDFIKTIYHILVPGGIWVNLGPLLYHYSDVAGENSIEPTYEDLVMIIENVGFEIVRSKTGVRTKYAQNPKSMLKSEYESLFWICRKPLNLANGTNTGLLNAREADLHCDMDSSDNEGVATGSSQPPARSYNGFTSFM